MHKITFLLSLFLLIGCSQNEPIQPTSPTNGVELVILGVAQDAGFPQAGCEKEQCEKYWEGSVEKRHVVSLGLIDHDTNQTWIFEATPNFPTQLHKLQGMAPKAELSGIFLTHAHIGHYTGLMHLGREAMGGQGVPVYAMPQMGNYLSNNGPWSQLVELGNIQLHPIIADSAVQLTPNISVTPFRVPHRDEFSETVGYTISTPHKNVLFIPDIDKWEKWERSIAEEINKVDLALLDATFYDGDELPNRNMSEIPHPFVVESMDLFDALPDSEREKVMFIHFNHTNPLLLNTPQKQTVINKGYRVAEEMLRIKL